MDQLLLGLESRQASCSIPCECLDSPAGIMVQFLEQLSEGECKELMRDFPLWDLAPDSTSISRTFVAKNFAEGMKFFNHVAMLADVEGGHYPVRITCESGQDLHLTDSRTVNLVLSTRAVKGLTIQDFNLASQIDKNDVEYSSNWLKENPQPIKILLNQDHDTTDMKRPERKRGSGIGELLRVGKVAPALPPGLPALEEGVDALKPAGPQLLSEDELRERLKFLSNWKLSPDKSSMSRTFRARNFSEGIKFFNAVAKLAEEYGHPPDLHLTECRDVNVVLSTRELQEVTSLDVTMAERINNLDVQYSEADQGFEFSLQKDPEISHPQLSEAEQQGDSFPMQEVQRPDTSQPPSSGPAKHQSRKSNKISFIDRFTEGEESQNDSATLLHSLILIFADAGAGGLSIQEAVRRMKKQSLPGLKEKGKAVQVAKITRNHPDFVPCDNVGCFALRKTLLRSFQCGSLDPEEYADEKKMEAIVFEKYAASAAAVPELQSSPRSSVQTPSLKRRD